jgi:hypothetical protein
MRKRRAGFAMAIFLAMTPIVTIMAWTFLKVGTVTRLQSIEEERRIRGLHSAEAAMRYHMLSGQPVSFELNRCQASANLIDGKIQASASPKENARNYVRLSLELDRGFVTRRYSDER